MYLQFFPSRQMSLYMARLFLVRIFTVLTLLVLVLMSLDMLGQSGDIMAFPGNGDAELWTYFSLRLPQIIDSFMPYSVLLATIITLAGLNQHGEVIAMKAAGLSAHQILAPMLITSMLISAMAFGFSERVVARSTATLNAWQAVDYGPIPEDTMVRSNIWVRDGNDIIRAAQVTGQGMATELGMVSIYQRSASGALQKIISADVAGYTGSAWRMADALSFDVQSGKEEELGTVDVASQVTPDQFTLNNIDSKGMSFFELKQAISDLRMAGRPTVSLETDLWHKLVAPLSAFLMPLLGAVAGFGLARSGRLFVRAVIGMALGFTYFVADNFSLAMGNLGAYPPIFAAWGPFVLFFLVGEAVLIQTEE